METLTRCYRYRYVLFPLRNTTDREFDCGSISFFRLPAYRLRLSSPGCADQGSATWKRRCETFKASAGRGPVQNSMKKKIDWEVVGVVLFIFTLFPFVWFYRELIQQTYEIRRNHGKDR